MVDGFIQTQQEVLEQLSALDTRMNNEVASVLYGEGYETRFVSCPKCNNAVNEVELQIPGHFNMCERCFDALHG